jgi:hypothetical protein
MNSLISEDQTQAIWYRNQLLSWGGEKNSIYFHYETMYKMFLNRIIQDHGRPDLAVRIDKSMLDKHLQE